jgi:DNA invertase Pin-like site-specific DNA recombinase
VHAEVGLCVCRFKLGNIGYGLCVPKTFEITAEFTEIETGKGSDALDRRPQLKAALKAAKKAKCEVAVAKLDRLSRDVAFIAGLMSQRVPFIVCALGRNVIRSRCTSTPRWPNRNAA